MRPSGILCLVLVVAATAPISCSSFCQNPCPQYGPCGWPYPCGGCCLYRPYPIYPPAGQLFPPPFPGYPPVSRPTIVVKPTPKPQGPVTVVVDTTNAIKEWYCPADNEKDEDYKLNGELPLECEFDKDCNEFSVPHKCCYHFGLDTHICKPAVTF